MLLAFLITDLTQSITYALVAQASHVVTDVSFPKPSPETGDMETDWMRLQVEASQDYSHGGKFMTWWTGGLNYQVVHHLFPQVCQQYYEEITPIVKAATAEFGVKYEIVR
jgi:linoleoyl-CoA desaturase